MSRYMPPSVFRSACLLLAACYTHKDVYEDMVASLKTDYASAYPGDDFASDMREGVKSLRDLLDKLGIKDEEDKKLILGRYYELSKTVEPNGAKQKKFLGFLGGTRFSGSHPDIKNRVHMMTMEFTAYTLNFPDIMLINNF